MKRSRKIRFVLFLTMVILCLAAVMLELKLDFCSIGVPIRPGTP
jgi:hypothetical protein